MSSLVATGLPSNVRLRLGRLSAGRVFAQSDVYNIADRVREIDPSLYLVLQEGHERPWVVMEECRDGECRFVARFAELDQRILERLRYMLHVPWEKRFAEMERQVEKENEEQQKFDEETMEWLAEEMHKELVKAGMSDPKWGRSYRPLKHLRQQGRKVD